MQINVNQHMHGTALNVSFIYHLTMCLIY